MTTANGVKKGMTPSRRLGGAGENGALQEHPVKNSYATALFHGDPVKLSAGYLQIADATSNILGVFQGFQYIDQNTKQLTQLSYFPASTSSYAPINGSADGLGLVQVADANTSFIMQADASVTIAMIGNKYRVSIGTGNTLTGQSAAVMAPALTVSTTKGDQVRVVALHKLPDNVYGALTNLTVEVILSRPGITGGN